MKLTCSKSSATKKTQLVSVFSFHSSPTVILKDQQLRELSDTCNKNRHEVSAKSEIDHYKQKIISDQESLIMEKEREVKLCVEKLKLAIDNIDTLNDEIKSLEHQLYKLKQKNEQILRTRMIDSERFKTLVEKNKKVLKELMVFKNDIEDREKLIRHMRNKPSSDKEDMQNYFEDDENVGRSQLDRVAKLEHSLIGVNSQLMKGLEMLKKDYKFIKSQLNDVSDEVDYLEMDIKQTSKMNRNYYEDGRASNSSLRNSSMFD